MPIVSLKDNAGKLKKLLAFFAVLVIAAFTTVLGSVANAAVTNGIEYEIYKNYTGSTGVRPMDNPSVVNNYTLCKTGTFSTVNGNYGGGDIEGCGSDYVLIHYYGYVYSSTAQTLYFRGASDDGFWGKVGSTVVVNNWTLQGCSASGTGAGVSFAAGEFKAVDLWFFEQGGGACSQFYYSTSANGSYNIVPNSMLTIDNYSAVNFTDGTVLSEVADGSSYSSSVTAVGSGQVSYSVVSGELPPGLALNSDTGEISGTAIGPETFTFKIRATASDSGVTTTDDTENLTITVGSSVTGGNGLADEILWIGKSFSDRAIFSGFPTPSVLKLTGNLPPGLTVSNNGTISGEPTADGVYSFSLRGYNFVNLVSTESYTYTVRAKPVFTNDDSYTSTATLGATVLVSPTFTGSEVTFSIGSGSLPAGLQLNTQTGVITGQSSQAGLFEFRIRAINQSGSVLSASSAITIRQTPTFSASTPSNKLNKGVSFVFDFEANGYPLPTFSVASGLLPTGLALNVVSGRLSGTPTTGGIYNFTIRAGNSLGNVDATRTVSVTAAPRAVEVNLLQEILAGALYSDSIEFESFPPPNYSIAEGNLPNGLSLNAATGAISGTPSLGGLFNFRIKVIGGDTEAITGNYALTVNQPPVKSDGTIVEKTLVGKVFNDALLSGGYPLPTYSLSGSSLPVGLKLNATTGILTGTPTMTGVFNFTVDAINPFGTLSIPLTLAVQSEPKFIRGELPEKLNVGEDVSTKFVVTGFPTPVLKLSSGSLPDGLTLDPTSGAISGTATNGGKFSFVIAATNEVGTVNYQPITVEVIGVKSEIAVGAEIGEVITGKSIDVAGEGLKPAAPYEVVLRSTPQVIANGQTSGLGKVDEQAKIPAGLEPGWHSITLTSINSDGTPFEKAVYFQVTETLLLEEVSEVAPSALQLEEALTNDPEFYARLGLDPAATVSPAAVAEQVQQVTSVVASVALVSAAAAGAAAAAAAGGAASSAGGGSSGGARAGGASSSSSGGSSSGGSSSESESDNADYGNLEAEHDDFETDGAGFVDRLKLWKSKLLTAFDKPLTGWIESSAQVSPVFSRILNDGSYLRALFGSLTVIGYFVAVILGVAAVDPSSASMATSGRIAILVAIMALGTLDALFGILAMTAFVATSLALMPVSGIGDVRYLLAMFILGFAPSIMATTFRKIRRPAIENLSDTWERIVDLALIAFISVLTVISLVSSVSAFAGATVPLAADAKPIALAITAVAVSRVLLEEFAAKLAPNRLDRLNPTEVPATHNWQPWASLVLKLTTLILMIGGMVGMGWHLWVGAVLIFLPGIIGMIFRELPSVRLIHELIPGGIGALAFATLISAWSGSAVNAWLGKSELYGQLSFILIPLPVILMAILGMFAKPEEKLWQRAGRKWIGIAGGIGVFAFTVQVTGFIPTIFG